MSVRTRLARLERLHPVDPNRWRDLVYQLLYNVWRIYDVDQDPEPTRDDLPSIEAECHAVFESMLTGLYSTYESTPDHECQDRGGA